MIRVLFGSALPVLSLAMAASFLGGDILNAPGGEPLVVAAPGAATLQQASFDGAACAATLLFADPSSDGSGTAGRRIIGLVVRTDPDGYAIDVEDMSDGAKHRPAMVLFVDANGQLVGAEPAAPLPASASEGCLQLPDPSVPGPV